MFQIIHGLYWVARQCRQFHEPEHRMKQTTQGSSLQLIQTAPPTDECIPVFQNRPILILTEPSRLLLPPAPQTPALQQDRVTEELETETPLTPTDDRSLDNDTPIHQVQPLLGTTHRENLQLRNRNRREDITDVLGTNAFQGYVNTPLQTLDGIVVQQPKRFLPLAEEAKLLVEEIRIEKLNEQWAGIPHEKLLNQFFHDQLNSLQILEHLAPLELAKQHLPVDIIDILECLGKVDNIPFNQLYYIAENCADRYYTKVIETFVSIIKRQFADRQLLLVNTAHCLKFIEEYLDRQAQIWQIFYKHHNIPDDLQDLHLHFDDLKTSIETDFNHLKEAMSRNIQNIQALLNLQQMYSSSLCSHVNNIYSKLSELQKQIQHHCIYMNQGDMVQIEALEFDPDIDGDRLPTTVEKPDEVSIPGMLPTIPEVTEPDDENRYIPATNTAQPICQETDWPDAIPMQIPRVSSLTAHPEEQGHNRHQA